MVEETRQIKFTMKELAAALEAKAKDWKNEIPSGSVSGLSQDKDKKLIVVEYRAGKHDFRLVRYKYETVAAAKPGGNLKLPPGSRARASRPDLPSRRIFLLSVIAAGR